MIDDPSYWFVVYKSGGQWVDFNRYKYRSYADAKGMADDLLDADLETAVFYQPRARMVSEDM
jgi:hypothetical protein